MFFLAGAAASSALDLITTLQQTVSAKASATPAVQAFDPAADSAATSAGATTASTPNAPIAPGTINALLAVQGHPGLVNGDAFSTQLFSLLDSNGDGAISKSEFESVFGQDGKTARADGIFAQFDTDSDGAISQSELTSALQKSARINITVITIAATGQARPWRMAA